MATAFALTVTFFVLKNTAVASVQGAVRLRRGHFTRAEDAAAFGNGAVAALEDPLVDRAQRSLRNDGENVPLFLLLLHVLSLSPVRAGETAAFAVVFVLARAAHTAAYLRPIQPLRNRAYLLGALTTLALAVRVLWP